MTLHANGAGASLVHQSTSRVVDAVSGARVGCEELFDDFPSRAGQCPILTAKTLLILCSWSRPD